MIVKNLYAQPLTLSDGTVLSAAGTEGSAKTVAALDERDIKRLVRRELISVRDDEIQAAAPSPKQPKAQSSETVKET